MTTPDSNVMYAPLLPIVTEQNKHLFCNELASLVYVDNKGYPTAPYCFNKRINLRQTSEIPMESIEGAVQFIRPEIIIGDEIVLDRLFFELDGKVYVFNVAGKERSGFHGKQRKNLRYVSADESFSLAGLQVTLGVEVSGTIMMNESDDHSYGDCIVDNWTIVVNSINDQSIIPGTFLEKVANEILKGKFIGYTLIAKRSVPPLARALPAQTPDQSQDDDIALQSTRHVTEHMLAVTEAMRKDFEYLWSWHANIVQTNVDAGGDVLIAMEGSARFLHSLANVDIRLSPRYMDQLEQIALQRKEIPTFRVTACTLEGTYDMSFNK